ncbi:hypothetical protein D3C79_1090830 [compost metagenome]
MGDSLQCAIPIWPVGYTAEKSKTHHACESVADPIQFREWLRVDDDNSGQIVGSGEWLL